MVIRLIKYVIAVPMIDNFVVANDSIFNLDTKNLFDFIIKL